MPDWSADCSITKARDFLSAERTVAMHRLSRLLLPLALVMSVGGLTAGSINFDDATSGAVYSSASNSGVTVDFYTGSAATVCPCAPAALSDAYGAVPGAPATAFVPNDNRNGGANSPFLTDDSNGPSNTLDYFFAFSMGIPNLSLQLLDYRTDGGPAAGAVATLEVYSGADWTGLLGSGSYVIPIGPVPDGNVESLSALGGGTPILSARVTFSQGDVGTGIDNLEWTDVNAIPEPGTVFLFGTGLLALGAIVRKKRGGVA